MARELHRNGDRHGGVDRGLQGPRLPSARSERGGGARPLAREPRRCWCSRARRCARRDWCARLDARGGGGDRRVCLRAGGDRRVLRAPAGGAGRAQCDGRVWRIARCRASRRRPPWPGRRRARALRCPSRETGVPVRREFFATPPVPPPDPPWRLLVLGGSQGAATLNESVPSALDRLRRDRGLAISVVHQAGAGKEEAPRRAYAASGDRRPGGVVPRRRPERDGGEPSRPVPGGSGDARGDLRRGTGGGAVPARARGGASDRKREGARARRRGRGGGGPGRDGGAGGDVGAAARSAVVDRHGTGGALDGATAGGGVDRRPGRRRRWRADDVPPLRRPLARPLRRSGRRRHVRAGRGPARLRRHGVGLRPRRQRSHRAAGAARRAHLRRPSGGATSKAPTWWSSRRRCRRPTPRSRRRASEACRWCAAPRCWPR